MKHVIWETILTCASEFSLLFSSFYIPNLFPILILPGRGDWVDIVCFEVSNSCNYVFREWWQQKDGEILAWQEHHIKLWGDGADFTMWPIDTPGVNVYSVMFKYLNICWHLG